MRGPPAGAVAVSACGVVPVRPAFRVKVQVDEVAVGCRRGAVDGAAQQRRRTMAPPGWGDPAGARPPPVPDLRIHGRRRRLTRDEMGAAGESELQVVGVGVGVGVGVRGPHNPPGGGAAALQAVAVAPAHAAAAAGEQPRHAEKAADYRGQLLPSYLRHGAAGRQP
jgi:hypothetical protein